MNNFLVLFKPSNFMSKYLNTNDNYSPPPKNIIHFLAGFARWYFQPEYLGLSNLSENKPAIYVSNHTLLGLTDGPLYIPKIYEEKNIYLRVLVDNMHLSLPLWRSIMTDLGAVTASPEHAIELMEQKQHILVFPGGANEICKTKDNAYQLDWKNRFGFVRLAIEQGYPIIPIASLGGDELYDIVADKKDFKESKFGSWLKKEGILDKYFKGGDIIPPIIKGAKGSFIPKRKKLYYKFGEAIETASLKGDCSEKNLKKIRKLTQDAIYAGIEELKAFREEKGEDVE